MTEWQLLAGSRHFQVEEEPAYAPEGSGEHLYVHLEKEGLNTDQVAELLAKVCGVAGHAVGYAGRKDRHAITRQWFSVHFGREEQLAALAAPAGGRLAVLAVSRHRNKIRLGHLAGNRFRLGLQADPELLAGRLAALVQDGIRNRFGVQRFGLHGANLAIARAWALGDHDEAVRYVVDPSGAWQTGEALPEGFRPGSEGRVLGALRKGAKASSALRAGGDVYLKLIASAAQSAIANAVLDARIERGLLHRVRVGDIGANERGIPFLVVAEELEDLNRRAAPGVLDATTTIPLPGTSRLVPAAEVQAEEQAWAASTGMDFAWFRSGPLSSPGERRPSLIRFRSAPVVNRDADGVTWLELSLPSGAYATEVLAQLGVTLPDDRRG